MCAAFSKEGREFTKKYADSIFTTITKNHLSKAGNFKQVSSAISLFVGKTISEAEVSPARTDRIAFPHANEAVQAQLRGNLGSAYTYA